MVLAAPAGASEGVYLSNLVTSGTLRQFTIGAGGALTNDSPATANAGADPYGIAISPNGKYVYVANEGASGAGGISQYTVGAGGVLTPDPTPTVSAGVRPGEIAVSPNGQYVYVTNNGSAGAAGVSQYTIGAAGMLVADPTPTVNTGSQPLGIAVSPNGQYVYVTNSASTGGGGLSQYTIGAGGMLASDPTPAVSTGNSPSSVAVSPSGQYVYVSNFLSSGAGGVSQYTVSGGGMLAPDPTPTVTAGAQPNTVAISPNGQYVYVTDYASTAGGAGVSQYTIGASGMLTPDSTPAVAAGNSPNGIVVSPNGKYVYVVNSNFGGTGTVSQYTVGNGGMLAPASTPSVPAGPTPGAIAVAPDSGPVADFTAVPAPAGTPTSFASNASSADEPIADQLWRFGDGTTGSGAAVTHSYAKAGTYTVTLTTVDIAGCTAASPFFSGQAGPFTGQLTACSPDPAAQISKTVTVPPTAVLRRVRVRGNRVKVTVACLGTSAQTCTGRVAVTTVEHFTGRKLTYLTAAKKRKTKKTVRLARRHYSIAGGRSRTFTLTLRGKGKRLLAKYHRLPGHVTLTPTGSKKPVATKRIIFKKKH